MMADVVASINIKMRRVEKTWIHHGFLVYPSPKRILHWLIFFSHSTNVDGLGGYYWKKLKDSTTFPASRHSRHDKVDIWQSVKLTWLEFVIFSGSAVANIFFLCLWFCSHIPQKLCLLRSLLYLPHLHFIQPWHQ